MNIMYMIQMVLQKLRNRSKCRIDGHKFLIDHIDDDGQLVAVECYYCGKKEAN